jgi:type II secretory pathway component GspD/PulD (secretin)
MNAAGPAPALANGALKLNVGQLAGGNLEVVLSAAESNGDARVISRPKVVTLNNTAANIDSGVSFYIKTLSNTVAGAGNAAVAGGVSRLQAGLSLSVTPTIMGKDLVKLLININNSSPDEAQAVDGIPGILNNSATTSVIVAEGRTAVIAGLVKNTGGKSSAGLPFFQNIPILGALFRNSTYSDRNNELVMFITPQIVTPQMDLRPNRTFGEPKVEAPNPERAPAGM